MKHSLELNISSTIELCSSKCINKLHNKMHNIKLHNLMRNHKFYSPVCNNMLHSCEQHVACNIHCIANDSYARLRYMTLAVEKNVCGKEVELTRICSVILHLLSLHGWLCFMNPTCVCIHNTHI
jgi:hypothetical protein